MMSFPTVFQWKRKVGGRITCSLKSTTDSFCDIKLVKGSIGMLELRPRTPNVSKLGHLGIKL